ncbi:MAG: hypothetical protein AB1644_11165, partial [Candidatus Zixiibacteriota bacterium]
VSVGQDPFMGSEVGGGLDTPGINCQNPSQQIANVGVLTYKNSEVGGGLDTPGINCQNPSQQIANVGVLTYKNSAIFIAGQNIKVQIKCQYNYETLH